MESNTQQLESINKVEELSEQFEAFFKILSEEIDSRFLEIENQLNEKRNELVEATKLELLEVNRDSETLKKLETEIFEGDKTKRKLEDVNKYKELVKKHIERCENLEGYLTTVKEMSPPDILRINDKGILNFNHKKIDYVKKYLKSKGLILGDYKWATNQKKACSISEESSSIKVSFTSCWNDFNSVPFNSGENEIYLELNIESNSSNHSVGITNEKFNGVNSCIGCQSSYDACVLKFDGNVYSNTVSYPSTIKLPSSGRFVLIIVVDCEAKSVIFKDQKGNTMGPYTMSGDQFKVTFGMCSSGVCTYRLLSEL